MDEEMASQGAWGAQSTPTHRAHIALTATQHGGVLVDVCDELLWAAEVQGAEGTHEVAARVRPLLALLLDSSTL